MTVSGEVGNDGSYSVEDAGLTRELDLPVERVAGEWRISDPPAGTIISEDNFQREFEPHNVCFFDPAFDVLLPDPVYVPKRGHVATLLAQQLLDGPSDWLDPAVRSAFPENASLSVSSVPIETGIATVDLSENAQDTEPIERARMAAQLACTLAGLSEVTQVQLNAAGVSLLSQDDGAGGTVDYERYDPDRASAGGRLFAVQDGGMNLRVDDEFRPVPGPLGTAEDLVEVAVHQDGDRAVAVGAWGDELQVAGLDAEAPLSTILHGSRLTSPAWDRNDLIWAVNQDGNEGEVVAVRPDATPVAVRGPDLEMRDVDRLAISPDGTRMALVIDGIAYLAVVVYDGEAQDYVSIEQLRRIGPDGVALDVSWAGSERIVVLVQDEDAEEVPESYILDVFGAVRSPRGPVPGGAVSISAGAQQKLVAVTEGGHIMENDSRTHWVNIGDGTSTAYP
nr:LpqB family beta-propeller domain-containing protein [Phytoactinopolyspora mesophila]